MVCAQNQLRPVIKNLQIIIIAAVFVFCVNVSCASEVVEPFILSTNAAVTAETLDLATHLEIGSDNGSLSFPPSSTYADLYAKLAIKNREIALLRAQVGYDFTEKESSATTQGVSERFFSSEGFLNPLVYKSLLNFDVNLWTLVSSVLFVWLILRSHLRPYRTIIADQKPDVSRMSEAGIGELDVSLGFESKLDLARALMDAGETDAAREILEGVVASASADHRKEATSMLDSLAN
jgi:FimV-like protein